VVLTFVPLYVVRVLGSTLVAAGILLSLRGATRVVVPPLSGPMIARLSCSRGLVVSIIVMDASIALFPFAPTVEWVGALIVVFTVGNALFSPILKEGVTDTASDDHRAGVVTGMYVFQFGGEALTPAVFGAVLAVMGFEPLFFTAAAFVASYAFLVAVFSDD